MYTYVSVHIYTNSVVIPFSMDYTFSLKVFEAYPVERFSVPSKAVPFSGLYLPYKSIYNLSSLLAYSL